MPNPSTTELSQALALAETALHKLRKAKAVDEGAEARLRSVRRSLTAALLVGAELEGKVTFPPAVRREEM